jgi:hypothetical protein
MPSRLPALYSLIPGRCGPSREQSREHRGFRSRLVADASGASVLRDQGPIGRPGTARPMKALATVLFVSGPHWLPFDLAGWPLICGEIVLL